MGIRFLFSFAVCAALADGSSAAPTRTTLDLSGIVLPCVNCELTSDGTYRVTLRGEEFVLRPFEARRKLLEGTSPDQLAKYNKTGDLLRFLLGQEVQIDEAERVLLALLGTEGGRSTFILSFDSLYQSHQRPMLKLLMGKKLPPEVLEEVRKSTSASSDLLLEMSLLVLQGRGDFVAIVEQQLDRDLAVTLERLSVLEQMLEIPEIEPVKKKLQGELQQLKSALENTSDSMTSSYREAGLPPAVRRIMRKQRLLTLTGRAMEATPENASETLKELTSAWDKTLDTPMIHEAFRHLIEMVPEANEILEPIRDELMARDTSIQLMLNPPPPLESSLLALGGTLGAILFFGIIAIVASKKRWKVEQRNELRDGLSFDQRKELQMLLADFDLSGDVTLEELKQAYRRKAKEYHPDSQENGDGSLEAGNEFIELQQKFARAKELLGAFGR